jgi:uncharacterized membrane protein
MAMLTAVYILAAGILHWRSFDRKLYQRISDSIMFSTSFLLLLGLMHEKTLLALGSTKPFLFFAGMIGLMTTLYALRPRPPRQKR